MRSGIVCSRVCSFLLLVLVAEIRLLWIFNAAERDTLEDKEERGGAHRHAKNDHAALNLFCNVNAGRYYTVRIDY